MKLPDGWEVEGEEARPQAPEGWELENEPVAPEPGPERSALQAFGLRALNEASIIGIPRALAVGDTLKEIGTDAPGGLNERYHRHLKENEPIRKGLEQDASDHPVATIAGAFTPALLAGGLAAKFAPTGPTTFKGVVKQGAGLGALQGYFGGDADTTGGDLQGTAVDTAAGAAGGAIGAAGGAVLGKGLEWVGNKAANRLDSEITRRIASLLGVYGQKKKDAYQAIKNLKVQENMPLNPGAAQTPAGVVMNRIRNAFPNAEGDLERASAGNAMKEVRRFTGSQRRFNNVSGIPSKRYAGEVALRTMKSESKQSIRDAFEALVRVGTGASVGRAVAPASDFLNKRSGAAFGAAIAGGGPLWAVRKLTTAIMNHPTMLETLGTRLPGFGKALQRAGGNSGAVAGYVTALLLSAKGRETAKEVADEVGLTKEEELTPGQERYRNSSPDQQQFMTPEGDIVRDEPDNLMDSPEERKRKRRALERKTRILDGTDPDDESI